MKHVELEFEDEIKINSTIEPLILNIKADKIADTDEYSIKVLLKCQNKNRSKSSNTVHKLKFDQDFKIVLLDYINNEGILASLKEILTNKLKKDFNFL